MNIIRKATQQEIDFMHNVMCPLQDEVLACMKSDGFYLTGGTCLSRFYFNHRYSEDLDFFFDSRKFPEEQFEIESNKFIAAISEKFQLTVVLNTNSFKRLIVSPGKNDLKVELVNDPIARVGELIVKGSFLIDNKANMVANKITALYSRKTVKDYFDLFFLLEEFELDEVLKWAELKMMPIAYEFVSMSLAVSEQFRGEVLMFKEVSEENFLNFVRDLNRKLIDYARTLQ